MAGLFRAPAAPPPVMAAAPMPDPNSAAVQEAGKKQIAASLSRSGRASTILGTQGVNAPSQAPVAGAATVAGAPPAAGTYAGSTLGSGR